MNDIIIGILLSIPITVLLAYIQLSSESEKYNPQSYFTLSLFFYIAIMCIGNIMSVLVAPSLIDSHLAALAGNNNSKSFLVKGPPWAWYAFTGIFAFEIMIQKINITFFDKGVLTISEWISKAKNGALAATLKRAADSEVEEKQQLGRQLYDQFKGNNHIQTFAMTHLDDARYQKVMASLEGRHNIDVELYLANVLANEKFQVVKGILKGGK